MVMGLPKKPLYIVDIPRAIRKDKLDEFFAAIESIKDGFAYDKRYKYKQEYFEKPNVWVFMNILPDTKMLSSDRWKLWKQGKDKTLEEIAGATPSREAPKGPLGTLSTLPCQALITPTLERQTLDRPATAGLFGPTEMDDTEVDETQRYSQDDLWEYDPIKE